MNKEKMKSKVNKTDTKDIWGKKKKSREFKLYKAKYLIRVFLFLQCPPFSTKIRVN